MTGWLLTWLWQGLALALGTSAVFRAMARLNAATRYAIWWGVLLLLVWLGWVSSPQTPHLSPLNTASLANAQPSSFFQISALPDTAITFIVMLWISVALFKLLRVLPGLHALYRLKDACGPVLGSIEQQLPLWREVKNSGRPVQLMICNDLSNAAVLGLQQPFIAFPSRLLRLVSPAELDQILLHEYGHVQRRDDWTRLGQALLEAAMWIHPATHWITRQLNLEREVACDDWVVARTCAARAYAECLARVTEAHQLRPESSLVPGLFGRTPDVVSRVDRLLDSKRNATRKLSLGPAVAGAAIIILAATQIRALPLVGEFSEILGLPEVPRLVHGWMRGPVSLDAPLMVATVASPLSEVHRAEDRKASFTPTAVSDPQSDAAPVVAEPPEQAAVIISRQISPLSLVPGPSYPSPPQDQAPRTKNQGPFTAIGSVTRRASVAVAGSLTKASMSLANSFQP